MDDALEVKKNALSLLQKDQFDDVLALYGGLEGLEENKDAECWFFVGCAYMAKNDDGPAEAAFNGSINLNPDMFHSIERLCMLLASAGRFDEVITHVQRKPAALAARPGLANAYIWTLIATGRGKDVIANWDDIKPHLNNVMFRTNVGQLLHVVGQDRQAVELMSLPATVMTEPLVAVRCFNFFTNTGLDFSTIVGKFGNSGNENWLTYQAARTMDVTDKLDMLADDTPTHPIELPAFPFNDLPTAHSYLADNTAGYTAPVIDVSSIQKGLASFITLVGEMKAKGDFDIQLNNIKAVRARFAPNVADPIQVMSTGRCGTTALYQLLQKSEAVLPYHSYAWQMKHGDKNQMLYRVMTGLFDGDTAKALIWDFVKIRTAEIIYAYSLGKLPVLTGHWDTVFAPILHVLFPESRILYLHRNVQSVFKSFVGKNQWNNTQLQNLLFDEAFTDDRFNYALNDSLDLTQAVSWYLHLTHVYSEAYGGVIEPEFYLNCASDELFKSDTEAISSLCDFLKIPGITPDVTAEHYAVPVNAKTARKVGDEDLLEVEAAKIDGYIQQLQENGRY